MAHVDFGTRMGVRVPAPGEIQPVGFSMCMLACRQAPDTYLTGKFMCQGPTVCCQHCRDQSLGFRSAGAQEHVTATAPCGAHCITPQHADMPSCWDRQCRLSCAWLKPARRLQTWTELWEAEHSHLDSRASSPGLLWQEQPGQAMRAPSQAPCSPSLAWGSPPTTAPNMPSQLAQPATWRVAAGSTAVELAACRGEPSRENPPHQAGAAWHEGQADMHTSPERPAGRAVGAEEASKALEAPSPVQVLCSPSS